MLEYFAHEARALEGEKDQPDDLELALYVGGLGFGWGTKKKRIGDGVGPRSQ